MRLLGLDLNATRVRAVRGPLGDYPCTEPLDPPHPEMPLVLNLEGRTPILGRSGLHICRKSPHLVWQNILPQVGYKPLPGRKWPEPHGSLDEVKALGLVFQQVLSVCRHSDGVVMALPAYLSGPQVEMVLTIAHQTGLPILGSVSSPLAAALAAHAEQAWFGAAVVVDVDDENFTVATVGSDHGHARLLEVRFLPQLNERIWRERLLNALADCCILESRWDPRESSVCEQSMFDQLDDVLEAVRQGRMMKLTVKTPARHQNIVIQPHDAVAFCAKLRRRVLSEVEAVVTSPWPDGAPGVVLVTAAAARLPGLVAALQSGIRQWASAPPSKKKSASALEDFGSGLLDDDPTEASAVVVLSASAVARGAHSVASHFQRGDIACDSLHTAAPLPLPLPLEAGPARLHFQGQDYLLGTAAFALGRQQSADLVFDGEQWPHVAIRHCEIIYDHRTHMVCDRSRGATFVNDRPATQALPLRPGDWIRLGQDGPLLRFLGQSVEMRTTA